MSQMDLLSFWKKGAPATDTTQIEKAASSQGQKVTKKTQPSKDADLRPTIYLAWSCCRSRKSIFHSSECDRCCFWLSGKW